MQLRTLLSAALAVALVAFPAAAAPGGDVPPDALGQQSFLWGVTLSGYQNDGAHPAMDWADLEREGTLPEPSGKSADFRGHMDADLDRAQAIGLTAFRTSIEWARIEPEEGKFDKQEVAYVHRLLQGIRRRGMKPLIALHHFATPRWAVKDDGDGLVGWENPRVVARFGRYVDFVAREFAAEIDWYITFNEPSTLIAGGYLLGWTKPHRTGPMATYRATANVIAAHIDAYQRLHKLDPVAQVSIAEYNCLVPVGEDGGFLYMPTQILGFVLDKERRWDGNTRVRHLDYLALHYYGAVDAGAASAFPVQPWRWGVKPDHMSQILRAYYEAFHLPIVVAENGFATKNGEARADGWTREAYMVAHLQEIQKLKAEGVPVIGYMYWTLTDNYEWGSFDPRFGLYSVNIRAGDMTRRETPAVGVYREIIRHGGVSADMAARFPPPAALQGVSQTSK